MDLKEHLAALKRRHKELDLSIQVELQRPRPDEQLVKCLKRQKLRLKDRIAALSRETARRPQCDHRTLT